MLSRILLVMLVAIVYGSTILSVEPLFSDTFGTGENQFEIPFVTVGNPGNAPDVGHLVSPNSAGGVPYVYRMAKYEISEEMVLKAVAASTGTDEPLDIVIDSRGLQKPATSIDWFEAASFANWLNVNSGFTPAYKFGENSEFLLWEASDVGFDAANPYRNAQAFYFLPNVDEWYKAAFFDPTRATYSLYPNGRLAPPIAVASGTSINTAVYNQRSFFDGPADIEMSGGPSPYGVVALGGNVFEWMETQHGGRNDDPLARKYYRGGSWDSPDSPMATHSIGRTEPMFGDPIIGFRIASVPEPNASLVVYALCLLVPIIGRATSRKALKSLDLRI